MGFLFGLLTPLFGFAVFLQIYPSLYTVTEWNDPAWQIILTRLTTFGVMLNALLFFVALRLSKDSVAMGVLVACGCYLVPLIVMQFIQ